jgi:hypothetical protein
MRLQPPQHLQPVIARGECRIDVRDERVVRGRAAIRREHGEHVDGYAPPIADLGDVILDVRDRPLDGRQQDLVTSEGRDLRASLLAAPCI